MSLNISPLMSIVCSLLVLASCAPPPATPAPTPIPPTRTPLPPPIAADFPAGTFYHHHTRDDSYCVFQFYQDGTFSYFYSIRPLDSYSSRKPDETGTYSVDGILYTITSSSLTYCQPPTATYYWTYDGQNLTFQVKGEDKCGDRQKSYESSLMFTILK